jgi:hypothetical protein
MCRPIREIINWGRAAVLQTSGNSVIQLHFIGLRLGVSKLGLLYIYIYEPSHSIHLDENIILSKI